MKVQRAVVVTLTSALASHFKVLRQSFFNVMGKAPLGELSCTGTGLVAYLVSGNQLLQEEFAALGASSCLNPFLPGNP